MYPPEQWQTYNIIFNGPTYEKGSLVTSAYITVSHNGVLVQNHVEVQGKPEWNSLPSY